MLILLFLIGCNPYETKRINLLSKKLKKDSISVIYPIIECRRQSNTSSVEDTEAISDATYLTNLDLHKLLDGRLNLSYSKDDQDESRRTRILLDTIRNRFSKRKYKTMTVGMDLNYSTKADFILIPYLIWTRSTEDFDAGKCGKVGYRDYTNFKVCTWTRAQAHIFLIETKTGNVLYFRYNQWDAGYMWMPYENRIYRSFYQCSKKMLRKMGMNAMPPKFLRIPAYKMKPPRH